MPKKSANIRYKITFNEGIAPSIFVAARHVKGAFSVATGKMGFLVNARNAVAEQQKTNDELEAVAKSIRKLSWLDQ